MIPFVIGTAQFGQKYGIRNTAGAIEGPAAREIVDLALRSGIDTFDTARLYGNSEAVLGESLKGREGFQIVTKYYANGENPDHLISDFDDSAGKLGAPAFHGILIHNAAALLAEGGERIWAVLEDLKGRGAVRKVGVSVYAPEELLEIEKRFRPDLVQLPCNLLDQRFLSGEIQELKQKRDIEFHARSFFLQGLMLCAPQELPPSFDQAPFERVSAFAHNQELSLLELCLSFARRACESGMIDRFVVGVDSAAHLTQIMKSVEGTKDRAPPSTRELAALASDRLDIIDPRTWKR